MHVDRRFLFVLSASLIWALIVASVFYRLAGPGHGHARAETEKPVVVAARPLVLGTTLTRDVLKVRMFPESLRPSGAFAQIEDLLDRPVISAIPPDEPIIDGRLAAKGSGLGVAPLIPPGMRAISVRVNDVVGVAGFVLPGMRVDVLVTGNPPNWADTITRTVLQNVLVLSAGQTTQTDGKNQSINAPVVTLLVGPEDAEALTLANNEGHIQLVLRNSTDQRMAGTHGRQLHELYGVSRGMALADVPSEPPPARRAAPKLPIPAPSLPTLLPTARVAPDTQEMVITRGTARTIVVFEKDGTIREATTK